MATTSSTKHRPDPDGEYLYRNWKMYAVVALTWLAIWIPIAAAVYMR